jgi:hypothetical protein
MEKIINMDVESCEKPRFLCEKNSKEFPDDVLCVTDFKKRDGTANLTSLFETRVDVSIMHENGRSVAGTPSCFRVQGWDTRK